MKIHSKKINVSFRSLALFICLLILGNLAIAQEANSDTKPIKSKPAKNTFAGNLIIDNQTVMVPAKGVLEFVIQHRFGVINKGYEDFYGLFAPSNMRLGFNYTPVANLQVGFGLTKERKKWDGNVKYAIGRQSQLNDGWPFSLTYYGAIAIDTRKKEGNFIYGTDRISYFHQLLLARKFTPNFSVQIAPSLSWFNNVEGYMSSDSTVKAKMKNSQFSIAFSGSYMVTKKMAIIANYDQPITQHPTNNPHPNISLGIQLSTATHTFQMFLGNYQSILQDANYFYNQNDYTKWQYAIGFNITKR